MHKIVRHTAALLSLALVWPSGSTARAGDLVELYTTKMGAYSNPDDRTNPGVFFELVQELGRRSGVTMRVSDLPWSRALKMTVQDKAPALVFPLIRTPQRERDFSWPIKPLSDRFVFFGRADHASVSSLDALKPHRIGVIRGSHFERELRARSFANIDVADDAIDNAKKLKHKRIDFWYVTYNTASYTFEQLGFPLTDFGVAYTVSRSGVYIGANKSFPPAVARKLLSAFDEVIASGWFKTLLAKYKVEDADGTAGHAAGK